jgi:hypothetical protein
MRCCVGSDPAMCTQIVTDPLSGGSSGTPVWAMHRTRCTCKKSAMRIVRLACSGAVEAVLLEQQEVCRREGLYDLPLGGSTPSSIAAPAGASPTPRSRHAVPEPAAVGGGGGSARRLSGASAAPDDQRLRDQVLTICKTKCFVRGYRRATAECHIFVQLPCTTLSGQNVLWTGHTRGVSQAVAAARGHQWCRHPCRAQPPV